MSPSISIIIATFNADKFLKSCLDSIITQISKNVELIIIDGDSKDNTVDIIKSYKEYVTYWKSEPDKGIYDAWNKGIRIAKGDWIMFLGADDQLVPDGIAVYYEVVSNKEKIAEVDFISSQIQMIDHNGKLIRTKGWPFSWPLFLKEMMIAHPGALHSRRLFDTYGNYNIDYKIVGDYEFLLRAGKLLKPLYIDKVTVIMSEGGASDSVKSIKEHYKAVVSTGKYSKYLAFINASIVYVKFKIKKNARKIGLNLYIRKL